MAISKVGAPQGHVAEWLRNGLQNRVPRFNSGRGLQTKLTTLPSAAGASMQSASWSICASRTVASGNWYLTLASTLTVQPKVGTSTGSERLYSALCGDAHRGPVPIRH